MSVQVLDRQIRRNDRVIFSEDTWSNRPTVGRVVEFRGSARALVEWPWGSDWEYVEELRPAVGR